MNTNKPYNPPLQWIPFKSAQTPKDRTSHVSPGTSLARLHTICNSGISHRPPAGDKQLPSALFALGRWAASEFQSWRNVYPRRVKVLASFGLFVCEFLFLGLRMPGNSVDYELTNGDLYRTVRAWFHAESSGLALVTDRTRIFSTKSYYKYYSIADVKRYSVKTRSSLLDLVV